MKRLSVALLLAAIPVALSAAPPEPSLKQVVAGVEHHYNSARTLEADFIQRYTLGQDTQVESGHVYFAKPGKMRWNYESPAGKVFLTDGKYAYLYIPQEQQVRRRPIKQARQWQAAFSLLLGKVDLSRLFGHLELVRIHELTSPARWQLRGEAKSDKEAFREVWLDVNDRYQLLRIEIRQRDGSVMEFHFRRWRENEPLASRLFELELPVGTTWLEDSSE